MWWGRRLDPGVRRGDGVAVCVRAGVCRGDEVKWRVACGRSRRSLALVVIPAEAGTQGGWGKAWTPAFAGVTMWWGRRLDPGFRRGDGVVGEKAGPWLVPG
jgi:hypothetical protein